MKDLTVKYKAGTHRKTRNNMLANMHTGKVFHLSSVPNIEIKQDAKEGEPLCPYIAQKHIYPHKG